ncbi:MAG: hypothetical protein IPK60_05355 [Sandaracinaceae bacterium]|jgi:ribonuclease HII|nr:hypothetical protein [Sandaracinaceae bacterium]
MFVIGADENGLGPLLGPMIATAVIIETDSYDQMALRELGLTLSITDSKKTSAFGRMKFAESLVLAVAERLSGTVPTNVDEFVRAFSVDAFEALSAPCPESTRAHCWGEAMPLPCYDGDIDLGRRALDALEAGGVTLRGAKTRVICVQKLNEAHAAGINKLQLDLHSFEWLLEELRAHSPEDVLAICGMVGGLRKYTEYFTRFAARGASIIEEEQGRSAYQVPGVGKVAFEIDADDWHLPVALASLVGKYVREILTDRQNRFYRRHDETLERVSGYRDPRTKKFIHASKKLRRRLKIVKACFERVA